NADGSGLTRLASNVADRVPAWSPDGGKIAFMSFRDGNWEIYLMHADGSGLGNLTNNPAHDGWPAWTPDGPWVAFVSPLEGSLVLQGLEPDGSSPTGRPRSAWL